MSATLARGILLVGSVVGFLIAAKAHGRQLRLERQLAGHWQVRFGAPNDPWVEALWQRERLVYWVIAIALLAAAGAYLVVAPRRGWPLPLSPPGRRSWWALVPMAALWPMIVAFVATGLASLARFVAGLRAADGAPWMREALYGSAAWWVATLAVGGALAATALRAHAPCIDGLEHSDAPDRRR